LWLEIKVEETMSSKMLISCVIILSCFGCASDDESTQVVEDMGSSMTADSGPVTDATASEPDAGTSTTDMETVMADTGGTVPDAGSSELTPVAQAEASAALADAVCEFSQRCQLLELLELVVNEPCGDFVQKQFEDGTLAALEADLATGQVQYDGLKMAACIAELSDSQCDADLEQLFSTCDSAFVGQVPQGEPCRYNQVCQDEQVCVFSDACPGQCAPAPAAGEACTQSTGCSDDLICHDQICKAPLNQGSTCDDDGVPCAAGLFCKTNLILGSSSCGTLNTNPVGRGQTCDLNGGPFCTSGLSCVFQDSFIPRIPEFKCLEEVSADATCFAGAPDQCPDGYFCDGLNLDDLSNLDIEGSCIALPNDGEACAESLVGEVCNRGLVCSNGLCTPRARISGACTSDAACYSDTCSNDICTRPQDATCQ
jgi:hypothetical protein